MKLQEITTGLSLSGVEPTQIVNVVTTVPVGDGARETGNVALFWSGQLVAVAERVGEVLKPRVVVVEQ